MADLNEVEATPEEEAQLQQVVDAAMQVIHGEGATGDEVAKMVLDAPDVIKGLGEAAATVVMAVSKQIQITDDVKWELAYEVVSELVDLAVGAGAIGEDEITEQTVEKIVQHAVSYYISLQETMGELNPQELQASVADAQGVVNGS